MATLDIYAEEQLLTRGAVMSEAWAQAMRGLADLRHVVDVRTIGLVAGIELASRPDAPGARGYEIFTECFERGLLIRVTGDTIALSPPLILEADHIEQIVSVLSAVLARVA